MSIKDILENFRNNYDLSEQDIIVLKKIFADTELNPENIIEFVKLLAEIISAKTLPEKANILSRGIDDILDSESDEYEVPMRSEKEILAAEKEFYEKVWYNRHMVLEDKIERGEKTCNPKIWRDAKKAARKIEKKYGIENLYYDDFEWGMVNGKLSALRWVMGDDWDCLDT